MSEEFEPDLMEQLIITEGDLLLAASIYREMMSLLAAKISHNPATMFPYSYFETLDTLQEERVVNYLAWRLAKYKLDVRAETIADCATKELRVRRTVHDSMDIEYVIRDQKK